MLIFGLLYLYTLYLLKGKINSKVGYMLSMLPFVLIIMFRFGIGSDYFSYDYIYYLSSQTNIVDSLKANPTIEPLYKATNVLFSQLGFSYHLFTVVYCSLILFITLKWLRESSVDFYLSVLLYFTMFFFVWNLSALRQGVTIAFLTYVFFNKEDKYSWKIKLSAVVVSFFFHEGSIIFLPLYLLSSLKWQKKYFLYLFGLSLIINFLPLHYIVEIPFLPFRDTISYYLNDSSTSLLSFSALFRIAFFTIVYTTYESIDVSIMSKKVSHFIMLSYISFFTFMFAELIASRIAIYGYFLMLVYIPALVYSTKPIILMRTLLASTLLFTFVSFVKESNAMIVQSGYNSSFLNYNVETVLTNRYGRFDTHQALLSSVVRSHEEDAFIKGKPSSTIKKIETFYDNQYNHLSVYFNGNDRFGTINTKGDVVELPIYEFRYNIIKDKAELKIDPFRFNTTIYRTIGTDNGISYKETQELVERDSFNKTRFDIFYTNSKKVDYNDLDLSLIEEDYNLAAAQEYIVYTNDSNPNVHYLEIRSETRSLYTPLDKNYKAISQKLYFNMKKYDIKGVAIGVTTNHYDLINLDGEVFWSEPIEKMK